MYTMNRKVALVSAFYGVAACCCTSAVGNFIHFGQADRDAWFDALPGARTITFQEHPTGELDRFFYEESHGVVFSTLTGGGSLQVEQGPNWSIDGHGLAVVGPLGSLIMSFTEPMTAFAGDFNGIFVSYEVYSEGALIGSGEWPISGPADFHGFISDTPFDQVRLQGHSSFLAVDDLHFAAIPAPMPWLLLVAAGLSGARRRRGIMNSVCG